MYTHVHMSFSIIILTGSGNSLSIHSNGTSVAVAMSSGSVRIYDIKASKLQQHYILHDNTKGVAWHPHANYLLTCGNDGTMRVVDVMEGRPLYTLAGHKGSIESVTFSHDGDNFASGGHDQLIKVFNKIVVSDCLDRANIFLGMENKFYFKGKSSFNINK